MKLKSIYKVRAVRNGFTLIELIMVMVLLSIVSVTAFIAISSYRTQHLYAAAERIAGDLRYAKNLALTSTKWHGVVFNVDPANTYSLYETDGLTDTLIKKPEDPGQDFTVNLSQDYSGISISNVSISGGSQVEFNPYGAPYTDKTGSALTSTGIITLSGGGPTASVCISPESGRIDIQ